MSGHGITGLGARFVVPQLWGDILVMDSGSSLSRGDEGCLLVAGSHCSRMAARFILPYTPRAVILHDAGGGKKNCGTAGLEIFDLFDVPAAAVSSTSARIGNGRDVVEHGRLSAFNALAAAAGAMPGMDTLTAMRILAAGSGEPTRVERTIQSVVLADTASFLGETERGAICVVGSHGSDIVAHHLIALEARAVFANDAGGGKENAGFSGLAILERAGIPAAVYDCNSAIIGNALDAWNHGVLSHLNAPARACGWQLGATVQSTARGMD